MFFTNKQQLLKGKYNDRRNTKKKRNSHKGIKMMWKLIQIDTSSILDRGSEKIILNANGCVSR